MSNIKLNDILQDILAESTEEKIEYTVEYFFTRRNGEKDNEIVKIKASSPEEAIKLAKQETKNEPGSPRSFNVIKPKQS